MKFNIKDGQITLTEWFYSDIEARELFKELRATLNWQQDEIKIFGKVHLTPRLQAWYADEGKSYSYSGLKMRSNQWTPLLQAIKLNLEQRTGHEFNSVLANLYRTGQDSNGWHSDNEKELGINPVIASLSFGESRIFKLKHRKDRSQKLNIPLHNGSLLLMQGETQHNWLHTIAKTKRQIKERINLTFRYIH